MNLYGFTFVRNAITYDYPVVASIRSILPLCKEVIVAVGRSDDSTLELIQSIDPKKVRIIETEWDDNLRQGGQVLAEETNKALAAIPDDTDWAFYIQADEVIHENDHPAILAKLAEVNDDPSVEGLLFDYMHFYGSYHYYGASARWYQQETRIIRPHIGIYSYRDAQGFRKGENEKMQVARVNARVFHYGWVKSPPVMHHKTKDFNKLWHSDQWVKDRFEEQAAYDYKSNICSLKKFTDSHPRTMHERIAAMDWEFDYDIRMNKLRLKDQVKNWLNKHLNINLNYSNYKVIS